MSDPQSLEEAHESLRKAIAESRWGDVEYDIRALAQAVLEAAVSDGRAGLGSSRLQRQIEALGR